jgi:2-iminobutanoate/2-iminopropanoate deaminase
MPENQRMKAQAAVLLVLIALALAWPLARGSAERPARFSYVASTYPAAAAPVSAAVRAGDALYLAGHLGVDPLTGLVPADAAAEARLLMEAVQRTLRAAGLEMDDLVSVTVFCTQPSRNEVFDAVYRSYFHGHYPARGMVGAATLPGDARFEVLGVAIRTARSRP